MQGYQKYKRPLRRKASSAIAVGLRKAARDTRALE